MSVFLLTRVCTDFLSDLLNQVDDYEEEHEKWLSARAEKEAAEKAAPPGVGSGLERLSKGEEAS